jgi:arylsulfatase A-like enzyme
MSASQNGAARPSILLIYTDQQRPDSLGCYGNPVAVSPNIDGLAREGVRLNRYYVQNPVCMPSRMSFLTGRYPASLGIGCNGIPFPGEIPMLHQMLSKHGYRTAQIGKMHFTPHANRDHAAPHPSYGFDTFMISDEPGCYDDDYIRWVVSQDPSQLRHARCKLPPAALASGLPDFPEHGRNTHEPYAYGGDERFTHSAFVAEQTCRFIRESGNGPFFAIAGFFAPHPPVNPPQRFIDMFDTEKMDLPVTGGQEHVLPFLKDIKPGDWKRIKAAYFALAAHVDDCAGRILKTLADSGKADNTIVIFTTDHGEYLGDHGQVQKGMPGQDCITRVPFIIRCPGRLKAGTSVNGLVEGVDIVPTLLDLCGVPLPDYLEGKSILPLFEGTTAGVRDDVFIDYFKPGGADRFSCVKTLEHAYAVDPQGREILFDLIKDPAECANMADSPAYRKILAEMRKRLAARQTRFCIPARTRTAQY